MSENIFRVDFKGILNILSKHLYSTEEVFIRELLQNSLDAISLRNMESEKSINGVVNVEIIVSENSKTIIFEDNGAGLTIDEVDEFLSVIGSSSKKQILDRESLTNSFIGQFGIGLLSCFMVSDKIILISKSDKSKKAVKWEASINGTYTSSEFEADSIDTGTKIFLKLDKQKANKYSSETLEYLLVKYSQFLPLEVNLIQQNSEKSIVRKTFPWNSHAPLNSNEIIEFGRNYFNIRFNHFIHLTSDNGKSNGIGYIYPFPTDINSRQTNHVYIKNMLIDEKSDSILPDWAFFVKAVISSDVLKPTASRESIYNDDNLASTRLGFEKSIRNYFRQIAQKTPSILEEIIGTHSLALKSFATSDNDFFELISNHLQFPSSIGQIKVSQIKNFQGVKYVDDIDVYRQMLPIAIAKKEVLINGGYIYDSTLLSKISNSSEFDLSKLDNIRFENFLNDVSWDEDNALSLFIDKASDVLLPFRCNPVLKKFKPTNLPAIYYSDRNHNFSREIERTKTKTSELWSGMLDEFSDGSLNNSNSKLYINIENELVKKIITIKNPNLFQNSLELIYLNSLMTGHFTLNELEAERLNKNLLVIIEKALEE